MFHTHLFPQTSTVLTCLLSMCLLSQPNLVQAGCGCDKAPPAPAQVRPHATYAGQDITIFDAQLRDGQGYLVTFTSGSTGKSVLLEALATTRRDVADGLDKPQLAVPLPSLPLGPTSLSVIRAGDSQPFLVADDSALTVVPQPIALPTAVGEQVLPAFHAAVGRDGTVYVSLDLTNTTLPRTFHAQALGYPLRFTQHDVVFYNTQGFVMQLLEEDMPGLFAIETLSSLDSDTLQYARHEFNTYFLQHAEQQAHSLDVTDANWHTDGTPHIEHNHLIVAIGGFLADGTLPLPGATPAFDLVLHTASLFEHGLVGTTSVALHTEARTASYDSRTATLGGQGDVFTNGTLTLTDFARVDGNATAAQIDLFNDASITGTRTLLTQPRAFLTMEMPSGLEDLGKLEVWGDNTLVLSGPGSFQVASINVSESGRLVIDNAAGPVTLYVTGAVDVSRAATIVVTHPDPEAFAVYLIGTGRVNLSGAGRFHGVVYAPQSHVDLAGVGEFFGALVGNTVKVSDTAQVYYDPALRGKRVSDAPTNPQEPTGSPDVSLPPADVVILTQANYANTRGRLVVYAESDAAPDATLTVSIGGFVEDAPMTYNAKRGRYQYLVTTDLNLDDRPVTVTSDLGGSASGIIQ